MARFGSAALLLVIAASALVHSGCALKCWSCSSDADPDCADPFYPSHKTLTECKAKHKGEKPTCEAIVLKVNTLEVITMRNCGSVPMNGPMNVSCNVQLPPHSSIERCHVCTEDGCNTAPAKRSTYWVAVVSLLVAFLNGSIKCYF
ncbi:uncharacterized protein LOC126161491 [Schistocerca cancellata]|uniref:uncharacterized protein LOC126161491 n=1 Tax=Schistocerca cancellata TaxID=274614 RepID=UPI002118FAC3|nr:uncharacterized protein LOC126161491 [Schistocerca cancellata]